MLSRVVAAALRVPIAVYTVVLLLIGLGTLAYRELNIEAYPNPVPPMIEVIAQPSNLGPEEVEKYVTVPLEVGLAGIPGLSHIRSQSLFGLSDVKCYFEWGADYEKVRQEVINRLTFVQLPPGVQAELSAWSAVGEIYRYTLTGKGYSLMELKTAQDVVLERQFRSVNGVADVVSFGGETKQYHVSVDPTRLRAEGVSLAQVESALGQANQSVGGQRLTVGSQSYDVRGVGLIKSVKDIEAVVVTARGGTPVRIRDIGTVDIGPAPRLGVVGRDDNPDVVQGVILMRYGAETGDTLAGVHARVDTIREKHLLPPGMEIVPYYDRGDLVGQTTKTVRHNLVVGMMLVALVLVLFLGNARAALIAALTIPLALLVAFCGLKASHTSANLISLGAIDFGIFVDSSVIMTEAIFRKLGKGGEGKLSDRITAAAKEVAGPMVFSTFIIAVSFLPLFTMTGVAGVIFSPMARTYAFAIGGAILLALTLVPVLAHKLLKETDEEKEGIVMRTIDRVYHPLFSFCIKRPYVALVGSGIFVISTFFASTLLGGEFMPKLEEGNVWIRATLPVSISREQSTVYANKMRAIVRGCDPEAKGPCDATDRKHPEIRLAISQVGRPDDGTDVTGFNNIEILGTLTPADEWAHGQTKEKLVATMEKELEDAFPGVTFNFSQMISDNVEEAVAGVKGANSIKVFGPDIAQNEAHAKQVVSVLSNIRGVEDLGFFKSFGQPNLKIVPNREAAGVYGLNAGDVLSAAQAAIGGQSVTRIYEGDASFELTVRFNTDSRGSADAIRGILIDTPDGAQVPLAQLASVEVTDGPATIYREDNRRYTPAKFSVRDRDLAGAVAEAQATVAREVKLPYDASLEWSGELNELNAAKNRLMWVIPLTILLAGILAFLAVRTGKDTLIVLCNVPIACAGGIIALLVTGTNFSVSAAMGFVSIFGVAVQDAILVVTFFQRIQATGVPSHLAAEGAVRTRLRPVFMTSLVATLGLLPTAISHGIGSQTQKPLAIVVIGGALCLLVASRVMQPALLTLLHRKRTKKPDAAATTEVAPTLVADALGE